MLTALAIAAGTDYMIFLIGRYQEARNNGATHEESYYTTIHSVSHVILGSGLTWSLPLWIGHVRVRTTKVQLVLPGGAGTTSHQWSALPATAKGTICQ
jgi:hypothetical protein